LTCKWSVFCTCALLRSKCSDTPTHALGHGYNRLQTPPSLRGTHTAPMPLAPPLQPTPTRSPPYVQCLLPAKGAAHGQKTSAAPKRRRQWRRRQQTHTHICFLLAVTLLCLSSASAFFLNVLRAGQRPNCRRPKGEESARRRLRSKQARSPTCGFRDAAAAAQCAVNLGVCARILARAQPSGGAAAKAGTTE
jgi:hypothetical protein